MARISWQSKICYQMSKILRPTFVLNCKNFSETGFSVKSPLPNITIIYPIIWSLFFYTFKNLVFLYNYVLLGYIFYLFTNEFVNIKQWEGTENSVVAFGYTYKSKTFINKESSNVKILYYKNALHVMWSRTVSEHYLTLKGTGIHLNATRNFSVSPTVNFSLLGTGLILFLGLGHNAGWPLSSYGEGGAIAQHKQPSTATSERTRGSPAWGPLLLLPTDTKLKGIPPSKALLQPCPVCLCGALSKRCKPREPFWGQQSPRRAAVAKGSVWMRWVQILMAMFRLGVEVIFLVWLGRVHMSNRPSTVCSKFYICRPGTTNLCCHYNHIYHPS